jgi:hypothetical protein
MDIIKKVNEAKKAVSDMKAHLRTRPDEKLIKGYKMAMADYERTDDYRCKAAADQIKEEIDRRGLEVE